MRQRKPGYVDAKSVYRHGPTGRPAARWRHLRLPVFVRRGLQEADSPQNVGLWAQTGNALWGDGTDITSRPPWFNRTWAANKQEAAIIEAVLPALLSLALLRRGWQVTLYCADEAPALGASGNAGRCIRF